VIVSSVSDEEPPPSCLLGPVSVILVVSRSKDSAKKMIGTRVSTLLRLLQHFYVHTNSLPNYQNSFKISVTSCSKQKGLNVQDQAQWYSLPRRLSVLREERKLRCNWGIASF